jgi:D-alanyl-D-alanine carboxypeptidase/D-alanyl-D-alanine-endopeptidase (penicillin-binding protein 4)
VPGRSERLAAALWPLTRLRRWQRIALQVTTVLLAGLAGVATGLDAPVLRLAALAAGAPTSSVTPTTAPPPAPPPAPPLPRRTLRPVTDDGPAPTPTGVAALLEPLVAAGGLGALSGQVLDPATGTVLWQRAPTAALVPGSTAKLLTAAAALLALDHQARLRTTVVAGAAPGTVVLVGGGDPTLSAAAPGTPTSYPGAARLDDLAAQVRQAAAGPIRRVIVDVHRYQGDPMAPGWLPEDVAGGYIAPIEPVMLDGGRADPTKDVSPRAAKPATAAAAELARRLGADPDTVTTGSAPPGATVLGQVWSPPVADLVATALRRSDNVLAEALAREVARASGEQPSFTGAAQAVLSVLRQHGFDIGQVRLVDGSGLSTQDAIPARLLTELLAAAAAPDHSPPALASAVGVGIAGAVRDEQRTAALRPLLVGLPVAGGEGTLADRYHGSAAAGRGWVRAKTGTLTGVNSLAGTVLDADGRVLVFALLSNGPNPASVRPRLDVLAAALRSCGCH